MNNEEQIKYELATKRVKKIKGFYSHVAIYIVVNIMIFILNIQKLDAGGSYFQFKNFSTLFFWGIGLASHGFSVFGLDALFGNNWEERKIKELMEKEKTNQQKWN
jgi:hypothetical protein